MIPVCNDLPMYCNFIDLRHFSPRVWQVDLVIILSSLKYSSWGWWWRFWWQESHSALKDWFSCLYLGLCPPVTLYSKVKSSPRRGTLPSLENIFSRLGGGRFVKITINRRGTTVRARNSFKNIVCIVCLWYSNYFLKT